MKNNFNIFLLGGNNEQLLTDFHKNFNICYSINSIKILKDKNFSDLIKNNFTETTFYSEAQKIYIDFL